MRICLLARYFELEHNAGLGRIATELHERLLQRGHDVVTVATGGDSLMAYFLESHWRVRKRVPLDCDVYHALSPLEAVRIPRWRGVVTFNDLIPLTHPDLAGAGLQRNRWTRAAGMGVFGLAAWLARGCQRLVAISDLTAKEMARVLRLPQDRIDIVWPGIRADLEPRPKDAQHFRVGYLGQLDPRKRVDILVRAFQKADVDGHLVIGGTGPDEGRLRALADGDPRIDWLGFVPDENLPGFYNSLDLFVFPSAVEGVGLPILEAMACEKPVMVMRDAILPDDIKAGCWAVSDLTAALRHWGSYCVHGASANYRFAKTFDWEKTVDAYERLYREVAD